MEQDPNSHRVRLSTVGSYTNDDEKTILLNLASGVVKKLWARITKGCVLGEIHVPTVNTAEFRADPAKALRRMAVIDESQVCLSLRGVSIHDEDNVIFLSGVIYATGPHKEIVVEAISNGTAGFSLRAIKDGNGLAPITYDFSPTSTGKRTLKEMAGVYFNSAGATVLVEEKSGLKELFMKAEFDFNKTPMMAETIANIAKFDFVTKWTLVVPDPVISNNLFNATFGNREKLTSDEITQCNEAIRLALSFDDTLANILSRIHRTGPLYVSDIPNKHCREFLLQHGLITKCVCKGHLGFFAATLKGDDVMCVIHAMHAVGIPLKKEG
jgi:hypothetical protein